MNRCSEQLTCHTFKKLNPFFALIRECKCVCVCVCVCSCPVMYGCAFVRVHVKTVCVGERAKNASVCCMQKKEKKTKSNRTPKSTLFFRLNAPLFLALINWISLFVFCKNIPFLRLPLCFDNSHFFNLETHIKPLFLHSGKPQVPQLWEGTTWISGIISCSERERGYN